MTRLTELLVPGSVPRGPLRSNADRWEGLKLHQVKLNVFSPLSIGSTLMDLESTASSGRSTPAMLNGHGGAAVGGPGSAAPGGKTLSYTCCWDHCQLLFTSSPDLAEHIRAAHVDAQRGGVSVCGRLRSRTRPETNCLCPPGVRVSVERLQSVQHAVHQPELAAETHADPQRRQTLQGDAGAARISAAASRTTDPVTPVCPRSAWWAAATPRSPLRAAWPATSPLTSAPRGPNCRVRAG